MGHVHENEDKNEPSRFLGDGVSFRAKLIGVLEVAEARGDRMCQEALADLKMAVRAAGEHKQRIQVHVAIDGLRLRDDKTGDSLYHHPVHKISFIAQDMTDSRAFGYIFGSPDTGHRFFGIKTDKAASQVVIAMRDLFQVVFELKKKEIELAKQQLEGKSAASSSRPPVSLHIDNINAKITQQSETSSKESREGSGAGGGGGVAELVDLEQELCSLRRGLTQVEGLTPATDPFGDSFTPPPTATHADAKKGGLLPPPPSASARSRPAASTSPRASARPSSPTRTDATATRHKTFTISSQDRVEVSAPSQTSFNDNNLDLVSVQNSTQNPSCSLAFDVFTELDPLGTGRSKPYVDKKNFFQELKNPPKKILKDLIPNTNTVNLLCEVIPTSTESNIETLTTITSVGIHSGGSVSILNPPPMPQMFSTSLFSSDPFAETDPFDSSDPFTDFKEDPFTNATEVPGINSSAMEQLRRRLSRESQEERPPSYEAAKNMFNGPLQVSLPPEPVPKSPRMQRQLTEASAARQRPSRSKLASEGSPPPPLPPKKLEMPGRPPPRPPHSDADASGAESGPAVPRPVRKKEPYPDRTIKPRISSVTTNSSEDEYLSPVPPPLHSACRIRRPPPPATSTGASNSSSSGLDMTLSQLLTCGLDELAQRLDVPASRLAAMTLTQLTAYLQHYLTRSSTQGVTADVIKPVAKKPIPNKIENTNKIEFKTNFEDDFTLLATNSTFVANFDDFDKKIDPSYDRYAAFREIQEEELKGKSCLDATDEPTRENNETETKEDDEVRNIGELINGQSPKPSESKSPLKSLDELTIDSLNALYKTSISPKPTEIDAKIEDIKCVMKNLTIPEHPRRSVTPKENEAMKEDSNDRYAALREISIIEPQDEFESIPPEAPKERKRSDEKSDGFDNSDFFDCIDNSSLSFSHVDDAFRKSPAVKEVIEKENTREKKIEPKRLPAEEKTVSLSPNPVSPPIVPARISAGGSLSDIGSGSSPEAVHKEASVSKREEDGAAWSMLSGRSARSDEGGSPWSSDSRESAPGSAHGQWGARTSPPEIPRPRRRQGNSWHARQTSSSSRDVSPWEEDLPPPRVHRTSTHSRESRHGSSGSRERLDSGSGRDKDKHREKRDPVRERDRDRARERDRREISKDRDVRSRDRRSRERETDPRERDREYSRDRDRDRDYRDRARAKERDKDRHRRPHHSWDDDDYSDGDGSGVSTPAHERWSEHRSWRRDDRSYGSLGWKQTRRRDARAADEVERERRYGMTMSSGGRRSAGARPREPDPRRRPARREPPARDPPPPRHRRDRFRFSNDFSDHSTRDQSSPFENDFVETPSSAGPRKKSSYANLEGNRFAFDEASTTPHSAVRSKEPESPVTRFRFDSDAGSPRSLFEDDFSAERPMQNVQRTSTSIAEEDETGAEPAVKVRPEEVRMDGATNGSRRSRPKPRTSQQDIKKSESVNIFVRDSDPFDGDDFFACTGSDRAARRDNWPGDFPAFDAT